MSGPYLTSLSKTGLGGQGDLDKIGSLPPMKLRLRQQARRFRVGIQDQIEISDQGEIELEPDEQVTFTADSGSEYDVTRKSWGYYATPSLNTRLPEHGLRPALISSSRDRYFIVLVETDSQIDFLKYLDSDNLDLLCWMDDPISFQSFRMSAT